MCYVDVLNFSLITSHKRFPLLPFVFTSPLFCIGWRWGLAGWAIAGDSVGPWYLQCQWRHRKSLHWHRPSVVQWGCLCHLWLVSHLWHYPRYKNQIIISHILPIFFPHFNIFLFCLLLGIRGEINVLVKVELFNDLNRFRQSSCGVKFFCSTSDFTFLHHCVFCFLK